MPMAFEGFEFPAAVTAFFVLHYIWVDTFAVGAARTPYQLKRLRSIKQVFLVNPSREVHYKTVPNLYFAEVPTCANHCVTT